MKPISKRIAAIIIVVMAIAVYGMMPKAEKKQKLHVIINESYP